MEHYPFQMFAMRNWKVLTWLYRNVSVNWGQTQQEEVTLHLLWSPRAVCIVTTTPQLLYAKKSPKHLQEIPIPTWNTKYTNILKIWFYSGIKGHMDIKFEQFPQKKSVFIYHIYLCVCGQHWQQTDDWNPSQHRWNVSKYYHLSQPCQTYLIRSDPESG